MRRQHTYIIAEAGVNHNGSINMAFKLIEAAAKAGADAVKFQTFRADAIIIKNAPKANYQKRTSGSRESQFRMLKRLELDEKAHRLLAEHCRSRKIQFISTPFDEQSIELLVKRMHVPLIKVPSGEITNSPYLLAVARTGKPIILSTGMSSISDVRTALEVIAFGYTDKSRMPSKNAFKRAYQSPKGRRALKTKVTLLQCTSEYPTPFSDVNLRAMETLRAAFGLSVGLSDHTEGITVSVAASALGAKVIEKHFTLDRNLPGPDHSASIEPVELNEMVKAIRNIELALGSGKKVPTPSEMKNLSIVRRSLVAGKAIKKGEIFTRNVLACKRPGHGIPPTQYWSLLREKAKKDFQKDELITR